MEVIDVLHHLQSELRKKHGYQITHIDDVGSDIMINCPFHAEGRERNPSFGILKEDKYTAKGKLSKGFGNCFACGTKMPLQTLIKTTLEIQDEEAMSWLKASGYTTQVNELYETLSSMGQQEERIVIPDSQYTKGYTPYMESRGITKEVAQAFELGYTQTSMVIPIKDRHGVTRMHIHRFINPIGGRKFHNTSGANKDELLHGRWELLKYPEMLKREYLFIVESSIDMILLWQMGYPAVATMQAIPTQKQIEQIEKLPYKKLVIATDNDEAGNKGAQRYKELIKDKDLYRLEFEPHEKDIGDMTKERLERLTIGKISTSKQVSLIEELPMGQALPIRKRFSK